MEPLVWFEQDGAVNNTREYTQALKTVIKHEIKTLCEKLAETGEETIMLIVDLDTGSQGALGSQKGQLFMNDSTLKELSEDFLHFSREFTWDTYHQKLDAMENQTRSDFSTEAHNPPATRPEFVSEPHSNINHENAEPSVAMTTDFDNVKVKTEPVDMEYEVFQTQSDSEQHLQQDIWNHNENGGEPNQMELGCNRIICKSEPLDSTDVQGDNPTRSNDSINRVVLRSQMGKEQGYSKGMVGEIDEYDFKSRKKMDEDCGKLSSKDWAGKYSLRVAWKKDKDYCESDEDYQPVKNRKPYKMRNPKKSTVFYKHKPRVVNTDGCRISGHKKQPIMTEKLLSEIMTNESVIPFIKSFKLFDNLSTVQCLMCGEFVQHIRMKGHWNVHILRGEGGSLLENPDLGIPKKVSIVGNLSDDDNLSTTGKIRSGETDKLLPTKTPLVPKLYSNVGEPKKSDREKGSSKCNKSQETVLPFLQSFRLIDGLTKVQCLICELYVEHARMKPHWRMHNGL